MNLQVVPGPSSKAVLPDRRMAQAKTLSPAKRVMIIIIIVIVIIVIIVIIIFIVIILLLFAPLLPLGIATTL